MLSKRMKVGDSSERVCWRFEEPFCPWMCQLGVYPPCADESCMCAVIRGFQFEPIMSVFLIDSIDRENTLKISSVVVVDSEGCNISDTVWFFMICRVLPQRPVKAQYAGKVEAQRSQENL